MSAPKGNKNATGNKGGGRKTLKIEKERAEYLDDVFFGDNDLGELKDKIKGGRYSIFNKMVHKALNGNDRMLEALYKKAMPDNINVNVSDKVSDILNKEE